MLLIEDDPPVAASYAGVFSRHGWDVRIATTLHEAVDYLRARVFDVVWLDLNLSDSGWRETLARLPELVELSRPVFSKPARFIVASGFIPEGATFPHGVRVYHKALTMAQLLSAIEDPKPT